jgi:ubiquitin-protein ligase
MLDKNIIDINMFDRNNDLKLLKYNNNESYVTIHLQIISYPVKIITDFNTYCFADSVIQDIGLDKFNLSMCFKDKKIKNIIKELDDNIILEKNQEKELDDPFHIYQNIDKYDKTDIDYLKLFHDFLSKIDTTLKKTNEFLLSPVQIIKLIINEIKKVNSNKDYNHSITIDQTNIFSLVITLDLDEPVEIRVIIDPYYYPFVPPKIEYIKPKIKLDLLLSIVNLDILILRNWCPIITLEYLITNLVDQLKPIFKDYIIKKQESNINYDLEYEFVMFSYHMKDKIDNKIKINIPIPKQQSIKNPMNFWKSGIGYGTGTYNINGWNIQKYIEEQNYEKIKITERLNKINKLINLSTISLINGSIIESYIISQTSGLTILELEKNNEIYDEIFSILAKIIIFSSESQLFINKMCDNLKNIYEEIKQLFEINDKLNDNKILTKIISVYDTYIVDYKVIIQKELIITHDLKEKYCNVMKSLQFGNYVIPSYHTFLKESTKMNQSAIMRTLSEISSFKNGLPLNWESSIWIRVSKTNFNIFSFLISGPKDTPYENGLFEFHAYFPIDYPTTIPKVIIHTTDNGKVRFNPNLYANGKVCLSLLGTWTGQENEKWNPKTSTFLQVMISIQSLILVEEPYFNEPGYERDMHNTKGKTNSVKYNENLHPQSIRLGMINMIKYPPPGFEDVVKNHFSMKKEEIMNTTQIWEDKATIHKELITALRQELNNLNV